MISWAAMAPPRLTMPGIRLYSVTADIDQSAVRDLSSHRWLRAVLPFAPSYGAGEGAVPAQARPQDRACEPPERRVTLRMRRIEFAKNRRSHLREFYQRLAEAARKIAATVQRLLDLAVADTAHIPATFRSGAAVAGKIGTVIATSTGALDWLRWLASVCDTVCCWVADLAALLSGSRLRGYPYLDAVPKTECSPCGVARLDVRQVPRAPGAGLSTCPRHPANPLAQAQVHVLTA